MLAQSFLNDSDERMTGRTAAHGTQRLKLMSCKSGASVVMYRRTLQITYKAVVEDSARVQHVQSHSG